MNVLLTREPIERYIKSRYFLEYILLMDLIIDLFTESNAAVKLPHTFIAHSNLQLDYIQMMHSVDLFITYMLIYCFHKLEYYSLNFKRKSLF